MTPNNIIRQFFILLLILFYGGFAKSQNLVSDLDEKFHIEKSISERLEQTLKTRLDKSYFDITVEAKLKRKLDSGPYRHPRDKSIVEGETETEALKAWYIGQANQGNRNFELESLTITLGLSDQVTPAYRDDLKKWLQTWSVASFGERAHSEVLIRPTNIAIKNENSEGTLRKFFHHLGNFQNLIGMFFLGCALIFSRFYKTTTEKIIGESRQIETVQPEMVKTLPIIDESVKEKESIKNLKSRIAVIGTTLSGRVEFLINKWSSRDSQDYLKIAALLDSLAEGGIVLNGSFTATLPKLSSNANLYLPKAFSDLHAMDYTRQLQVLSDVYTELLAKDLIRISAPNSQFKFLANFNGQKLKEIFESLPPASQRSLLTNLPEEAKKSFFEITDRALLEKMLDATVEVAEVSEEDLLQALKPWRESKTLLGDSHTADFDFKMIKFREIWSGFSRKEETLWLHQVVTLYPEMKTVLKDEEPFHLAFVEDWPQEQIRKLCLQTTTSELAAAAKALPYLLPVVLNVFGDMTRMEIQKEMSVLEEPRLARNFEKFVKSYDDFVKLNELPNNSNEDVEPKTRKTA